MQLNSDGDVWVRCCMEWRNPLKELWILGEDGVTQIFCIIHNEVLLGYDFDLPGFNKSDKENT